MENIYSYFRDEFVLSYNKYKNFEKKYNYKSDYLIIFFFVCIVLLFEYLDNNITIYNISLFITPIIIACYTYIKSFNSIYQIIIGGLIASIIAFIMNKTIYGKIHNTFYFGIMSLLIISMMYYTNSFELSAYGYALLSNQLIPVIGIGYIFSYIIGVMIFIITFHFYKVILKLLNIETKE